MNKQESDILDDLDAWRKARVLRLGPAGNSVLNDSDSNQSTIVYVSGGKYSRWDAEPEMRIALENLAEAIKGLEPAKQKIIERKLYELRLVGMRTPESAHA